MRLFKTLTLLLILFSNSLFAQETITEKDYTLNYIGEKTIEIQFNKVRSIPTNIKLYNVTTHQVVALEPAHDKTKYIINNIAPAQVLS